MSVLENLKERIEDINKQIAYNLEIIENKKRDIGDLKHAKNASVLSYTEDLKNEMSGKIYETKYNRLSFILNINRITSCEDLSGKSLNIYSFNHEYSEYNLFEKSDNGYLDNISNLKNPINDSDFIYNRIENEILNAFDYFLSSVKNHHNLIFIKYLRNEGDDLYDCIVNEDEKCMYGNEVRFSSLSLSQMYGITLKDKRLSGKQIKRVKASDINVNQVFYDFYKRSVEFCKNMFKDFLTLHNIRQISKEK